MLDTLPAELVVLILVLAERAGDVARTAMASSRLWSVVHGDDKLVWRRFVDQRRAALSLTGASWAELVVGDRGVVWLARALDPLPDGAQGACIGYRRLVNGGGMQFGEFVGGRAHGYAVQWERRGNVFFGQWVGGRCHGLATTLNLGSQTRSLLNWHGGKPHGQGIVSACVCRPADDQRPNATPPDAYPPTCNEHIDKHCATDKYGEYGYVQVQEYDKGRATGRYSILFCNGDVMEATFTGSGSDTVPKSERFVMSPTCPDPAFRSVEIKNVLWHNPVVQRDEAKGGGAYIPNYPDPATAPDAFRVYHDYFKRGFMMIEERDREDIALLYETAARQLPRTSS